MFDTFYVNNISYFILWTFISLGLALIWGMGGILSFGQTAFFGLAGYSFAIISINFADTFVAGSAIFGAGKDTDPNRYDTVVKSLRASLATV